MISKNKPYFRSDYSTNPSRSCFNAVCIPLTKGFHALIDAADFHLLGTYYWAASPEGYAYRTTNQGGLYYLHKVLMGAPKGQVVDHANGISWDDRKFNLRFCTVAENVRNSRPKNGDMKGVYYTNRKAPLKKRWFAQITKESRVYNLGYYMTKTEAALAYNIAAIKYHGEFARLNQL